MKKFFILLVAVLCVGVMAVNASAMFMSTDDLVVDTVVESGDIVTTETVNLYRDGDCAFKKFESHPDSSVLLWVKAIMETDADRSLKIEYSLYQSTVGVDSI